MTSLRLRALLVLVATALVAAACGRNGDDVAEPPTEPAPTDEAPAADEIQLAQECTNDEAGYTVRYPAGWHVNEAEESGTLDCRFFHPEAFEVPPATEVFGFAVSVRREPVGLEQVRGGDPGIRVLESEDVEVAGREAIRRETEATGEGLATEGLRSYQYWIAAGDETIVVETHDVEPLDFDENRRVVDAMAQELEVVAG